MFASGESSVAEISHPIPARRTSAVVPTATGGASARTEPSQASGQ